MSVLILARHNISFSSGEDDWIRCEKRVRSMKALWTRTQKRAIWLKRLCNDRYARCSVGVADHGAPAFPFIEESFFLLIPHMASGEYQIQSRPAITIRASERHVAYM